MSCATGRTFPSGKRSRTRLRRSIPLRIFSSVFSWIPGSPASFFARASSSSSSRDFTPRFSKSIFAVLGPTPGTRRISRSPAGISFRSASWRSIRPVSANWRILPARSFPIPGIAVRCSSLMEARSLAIASTLRAARRYARIRKGFSPFSSRRSAISLKTRAIWGFFTGLPPGSFGIG